MSNFLNIFSKYSNQTVYWFNLSNEITCSVILYLGCDSTSSFIGKGKRKPLKVLSKYTEISFLSNYTEFLATFSRFGESFMISESVISSRNKFVCCMYQKNSTCNSVNELRYQLFKSGIYDEDLLPPTLDALRCHIERVNYQSYIWRNATRPMHNLDDFQNQGWLISKAGIAVEWSMNPVAL